MVHIDDVANGLGCNCTCPNCHEKLLARHGQEREHGFAHHSKKRQATLKICYMVILYKLAEQIIYHKKRIKVPSYYGIFKSSEIYFEHIEVDRRFDRVDKQPDVIATACDGKKYLIEFVFEGKAQHKQPVDYKEFCCLEIDLSGQSLESLERFLLESCEGRKWVNNPYLFNEIENLYKSKGKDICLVSNEDCKDCPLQQDCAAVLIDDNVLEIENDCVEYKLCKQELYNENMEKHLQKEKDRLERLKEMKRKADEARKKKAEKYSGEVSCLFCDKRLTWKEKDGAIVCCLGIPHKVRPEEANKCRAFKLRKEYNFDEE